MLTPFCRLEHYFRTIDCFTKYTNTLGIFATHGVINRPETTPAAEVIRAVVRDVKDYMSLRSVISGSRTLPVGVSNPSLPRIQLPMLQYFTAGRAEERVDFYALTDYTWVSASDMRTPGWANLAQMFSEVPIPCFLSEYGELSGGARLLQETAALYSPDMTPVFSGGFLYEFYHGPNRFGIVERDSKPGSKLPEFDAFKKQIRVNVPEEAGGLTEEAQAQIQRDDSAWVGPFPDVTAEWKACPRIPASPIDWDSLSDRMKDEEWTVVGALSDDDCAEPSSSNTISKVIEAQKGVDLRS